MDELQLLRAVPDTEMPEAAFTAARAALLNKINAAEPARVRRHRGARRVAWTSLGVLAAGAAATALVLTNVVGLAGWRGGADAAAAAALHETSTATIAEADPAVGPGRYLRVTSSIVVMQTASTDGAGAGAFLVKSQDSLYVPADQSTDWVWDRGASSLYKTFGPGSAAIAKDITDAEARQGISSADLLRAPGGAFYGSPAVVSSKTLAPLPTNAYQLLNYIYRVTLGAGPSPDAEAFTYIADTLRSGVVPAQLRAALYDAAALIPGVTVSEKQANLDGAVGVAVGLNVGDRRQEIIVDPSNGRLIGERVVALKATDGVPAGEVIGWTAITTTVVDEAPDGGTVCGRQGCNG